MAQLAIAGGVPIRRSPFPPWPQYDDSDLRAVAGVVESLRWCSLKGTKVTEFEQKFARYHDAKFGIAVANGTAALEIAQKAGDVGPGDEVIVPPYTFLATASAALQVNAVPVFADIDKDTFNIDPSRVREVITKRTKAIIPVHFAGYPADMDALVKIAAEHNLLLIEDAAHAHGAIWKGRKVGAIGDMGTFSFQETKNLTAGEGGIILTDNEEWAEQCFSLRSFGRQKGGAFYEHHILGWNYRMTEFQGALLLSQLARLEEQTQKRAENAVYLRDKLLQIEGIEIPNALDSRVTRRAYHLFMFRFKEGKFGVDRLRFVQAVRAEGLSVLPGYEYPLYKNPMFLNQRFFKKNCPISCAFYDSHIDYSKIQCPVAEQICRETVWIPQSVLLGSREDMDDVVAIVEKVRENAEELSKLPVESKLSYV